MPLTVKAPPAPSRKPAPARTPPSLPPPRRRERPGFPPAAAAASLLLHVLLFAVIRIHFTVAPELPRRPVPLVSYRPAMQAYNIDPIVVPPGAPEPVLPEPRQALPAPDVRPSPALPAPAAGAAPAAGPSSLRDRLQRTPTGDLEVWRPVDPADYRRPMTEEELLQARLAAKVNAYNDSLAADALARERATDWTVKDGQGGKWGVSPGRVHLGGVTLPLPFALTTPPGRRDEIASRTRNWSETQTQAARAEASDNFKERVKAIRERRQAERDSTRTPDVQ